MLGADEVQKGKAIDNVLSLWYNYIERRTLC